MLRWWFFKFLNGLYVTNFFVKSCYYYVVINELPDF
jgi:hypothetical protein